MSPTPPALRVGFLKEENEQKSWKREKSKKEEKCFIAIENKIKEQLRFMLEISIFDLCDGSRGRKDELEKFILSLDFVS